MGKQLYKQGLRRCYRCKRILPLNEKYFSHGRKLGRGFKYICKECDKEYRKEQRLKRLKGKNYKPRHHKSDSEKKYSLLKKGAKQRGYNWNLTYEQFMTFWQKPCYYCGAKIKTIGLDRVDNSRGYEIDNVVPCCTRCNLMKRILSKDDFINQCKIIAKRFS